MERRTTWLVNGTLIAPRGLMRGSVAFQDGRVVALQRAAPKRGEHLNARGQYIAPGLIDLHVWGDPATVSRAVAQGGTTSFLAAVGPESPEWLVNHLVRFEGVPETRGARCLGIHLEGPFLNPLRAGALASRWLRPPTSRELRQLLRYADGRLKLVTIAPEMPRGLEAIRWLARHHVVVSLGHSDANARTTQRAVNAGARVVTHVFNGMRPLHHRDPGLVGEVLTDDRLMAMVILDGAHVDPVAFQLLLRCKGPAGIVLVTDSIRHQRPKGTSLRRKAYVTASGTLAGSRLTMIEAVRNAVVFGKIPLPDAIRMASLNPARVIGQAHRLGSLAVGKPANLVVFDRRFRVSLTVVEGRIVYQRGR